ncbi:M16 family metallopeptidase [Sneathiella limimaris]|uniref:M16 family metallopeptidase n=1 Tax=Sneathiella limimaris TaxID=1964213 RepID=UPI00146EA370|nr:pitrilysin family protein [Sneathiella limimaris]
MSIYFAFLKTHLVQHLRLTVLSLITIVMSTSYVVAADIQEIVSPGGIKAWFVEESSIPIVNMEVLWKGGGSIVPRDKAGLADLMSATMDEGADELDSDEFQKKLAELSISLSFDARLDSYSGSLKTLSSNADVAFDLFSKAVTKPRFDPEPVERIKNQLLASLSRKQSNPRDLVGDAWFELAFPDHPYAIPVEGTIETVSALTSTDLQSFYKTQIAKDNMIISVIGDITPEKLGKLLDKTFGSLPETTNRPNVPVVNEIPGPAHKIIDLEIPQSVIIFGGNGLKREDPDYYAAYLLNYILGGGSFESRLFEEVREKRGLVYTIYSYLYPLKSAGLMLGSFGTDGSTTLEAINLVKSEIRKIREHGVTKAELESAKKYLNGSFPLSLSSNARIAGIMTSMQYSNLPITYLDQRAELINAVTIEDVQRVAQMLLDPEKLIITIAGKSTYHKEWDEGLKIP